jgi:hypothetical protein
VVETGGLENRYPADAGSGVRIPLPPPKLVAVEAAQLPNLNPFQAVHDDIRCPLSLCLRPNDCD